MTHLSECDCGKDHKAIIRQRTELHYKTGCWLWTGSTGPSNYGSLGHAGTYWGAHRFSYEAAWGDIPEGLVIDHLCRVPWCVNPAHLEAVTQQENTLRGRLSNPDLPPAPKVRYLAPDDPRHGKASTYVNWACRCQPCKDAHREDGIRKYRARNWVNGTAPVQADPMDVNDPGDPRHGTNTGYTNWRCRCDRCVEVGRATARARYHATKARKATA